MNTSALRRLAAATVATVALLPAAVASANPYAKGPVPTNTSVVKAGPYAYTSTKLPAGTSSGFQSGTLWVPKGAPGETFGGIAVVPGFTESESAIAWTGPRLASHGFVVVTLNTRNTLDQPAPRALQLLGALSWLTESSPAKSVVDPARLAVAGHSMGGGGTLEAALRKPDLKALIAFTPWTNGTGYGSITSPTLIIAADFDVIAPVSAYASPLYNRIPLTTKKAYVQLRNADHFVTNKATNAVASTTLAWAKRWIDDDTRYSKFICPKPTVFGTGTYSRFTATCPF